MPNLHCTLNIEVATPAEVRLHLGRLIPGRKLRDVRIEPYWKIPAQYQANFRIPYTPRSDAATVFMVLRLARQMAPSWWTVLGPESDPLVFESILNNPDRGHPLRWAHLQVQHPG